MKLLGLTENSAKNKLKEVGLNDIVEESAPQILELLFKQFSSPLILILLLAALVSLILADSVDGILILIIVMVNGVLGFWQEYKAERIITHLKKISVPFSRVIREGKDKEIESRFLLPGDIVILEQGDKVAADGEILE